MGIKRIVVERTRKNFIKICNEADIPRMREEKYPEDAADDYDREVVGI